MLIQMTAHTIDEEGAHEPDEIVEMRDEIAKDYIAKGYALEVKKDVKVERAMKGGRETAVAPEQKPAERTEAAKKEGLTRDGGSHVASADPEVPSKEPVGAVANKGAK